MRKVHIDFAPPGIRRALFRAPRGTWALAWAALVLGISLYSASRQYEHAAHVHALRLAQVEASTSAPPPPAAPARPPVPEAQASAVNAAVQQLNLPWRALRDAVQGATPASVALLTLEPDAKKRLLRITAEAKNSEDMIGYLAQLKEQDWFDAVTLVRHEINEQDPHRPIRFQIDATWGRTP